MSRKYSCFGVTEDRKLMVQRPCACGCDQRGGPNGVGYLIGAKDGHGFSVWLKTEREYQSARKIFGGDK